MPEQGRREQGEWGGVHTHTHTQWEVSLCLAYHPWESRKTLNLQGQSHWQLTRSCGMVMAFTYCASARDFSDSRPHPTQQCDVTAANPGFGVSSCANGSIGVGRGSRFSPIHTPGHPVSFLSFRQAAMHTSEPSTCGWVGPSPCPVRSSLRDWQCLSSGPCLGVRSDLYVPWGRRRRRCREGDVSFQGRMNVSTRLTTGEMAAFKGRTFLQRHEQVFTQCQPLPGTVLGEHRSKGSNLYIGARTKGLRERC